jgi:putative transposase
MTALARTASAAELAQALGLSKRAIARRAAAEGWAFEETTARGGTVRSYSVQALPAALRAKLVWQPQPTTSTPAARAAARAAAQAGQAEAATQALAGAVQAAAAAQRSQVALRQAGEMGAAAQARMDARLAVVRAADLFAANAGQGLPADQALMMFVSEYTAGTTPVPAAVRQLLPAVTARSIRRWRDHVRKAGITALAGAYGNRAGTSRLDSQPELRAFVQGLLVAHPHARATHVMKGLQARFEGGPNLPSLRALERWMAEWRSANAEVLKALQNPDAWKNKYMAAFGSKSEGVDHINALWERDSSPWDVMCADGRYCVIGGVDVFTRSAKLLVAKTSKAVAVGAHLRAMLLDYGVPDVDKTDNGSDYTALYTERVYQGLGVQHDLCPPFQPWHKPHVERFFGTFTRDLVELLPGYIGHSVAERNAIEARKSFADRLMKKGGTVEVLMTGAELQAFADNWLANVYDQAPHEGLGQRTPFELRAAHAADIRRIADVHALDVLLAEAPGRDGRRTVQKKGVKLDDGYFIAPELSGWIGQEVQVRYDPLHHDLGTVHVFSADGLQFICLAENPERTGMDRRDVAVKAKAMQRDRVQAERKALKAAAKKISPDLVVSEILRSRAAATGKLAVLPLRSDRQAMHTSPGLQAAGAAARAATAAQRTTADALAGVADLAEAHAARVQLAAQAKADAAATGMVRLPAALGPQPTPVFESPAQRVHWLLLQQAVRDLGAEEQDALQRFRRDQPASYHRLQALADEAKAVGKENTPGRIAGAPGVD